MSASPRVLDALRTVGRQLAEMSLPEDTDEVVELVAQQRQLLEAYVHSMPPNSIDPVLIRELSADIRQLTARAKQAHAAAANELDALTVARSAVSAYESN